MSQGRASYHVSSVKTNNNNTSYRLCWTRYAATVSAGCRPLTACDISASSAVCTLQCRDLCYHYYHYSYFAAEAPAKLSLLPEIRGNVAFVLVRSFTVELCWSKINIKQCSFKVHFTFLAFQFKTLLERYNPNWKGLALLSISGLLWAISEV